MDATVFIPREYHAALAALGKEKWLKYEPPVADPQGWRTHLKPSHVKINELLSKTTEEDRQRAVALFKVAEARELYPGIDALGRFLADGPKVFKPSAAQCEAMENVSLDLTTADYNHPYPAIAVELPAAYAQERSLPRHILVHHAADDQFLFLLAGNIAFGYGDKNFFHFCPCGSMDTLEKKVSVEVREPEADLEAFNAESPNMKLAYRVALNCCLALAHFPARTVASPQKEKLSRLAKSGNREKAAHAQKLLRGLFSEIQFTQEISFHTEAGESAGGPHTPTGAEMRPHWRKGHWRKQPVGPRLLAARKLVFIKPILVRKDKFLGDTGGTSVVYTQK